MVYARGAVGFCGLATARAGVRGPTRALRTEAHAQQMTFVAHNVPDLGADRGGVSPIPPFAAHAFPSPNRFEGFEGFATDESTSPHGGEQQQHIRRQMGQFAVASLIQPPAPADFLLVDGSLRVILGQLLACGFEFVNLATRARLMPIDASRIQKERAGDLHWLVWLARVRP